MGDRRRRDCQKYSNMAKRAGRSGILEERMAEKGGNSRAFPFSVFCLALP